VTVEQATLRPGTIVLVVVNNSEETARVAQIILNDAFVDFQQSGRVLAPGDVQRITVSYPWVPGESYDVQLMTRTGSTIAYEIEDAEAGTQQA
jgi:archaellum component FlaF (FlaF/FlaG flagellin family)